MARRLRRSLAFLALSLCAVIGATEARADPAYRLGDRGLATADLPGEILTLVAEAGRDTGVSVSTGHGAGRFTVRVEGENKGGDFYVVRRRRSGQLDIVPTELSEARATVERIDAVAAWAKEAGRAAVPAAVRSRVKSVLSPREIGSYRATLIAPGVVEVEDRSNSRRLTITRPGYAGAAPVVVDERSLDQRRLTYRRAVNRQGLAEAEYMHARSVYKTDRFLDEYKKSFGERFSRDLNRLRATDHWVDFGAGHAVAQRGYEYLAQKDGRTPARRTAIALTTPPPKLDEDGFPTVETVADYIERAKPKDFRFVEGRIESMPVGAIGRAQLITDHHGAFYYSKAPDRVLERALASLEVGGRFYAVAPGSDANLESWLADLQGARVLETGKIDGQSIRYLVVEKTATEVKVPRVRLDSYRLARFSTNDPVQRSLTHLRGQYVKPLETAGREIRRVLDAAKKRRVPRRSTRAARPRARGASDGRKPAMRRRHRGRL